MRRWAALLSVVAWCAGPAAALFPDGFTHPEVDWLEFETDHFTLVYNTGLESTARLAASLLESMHPELCADLGVEPSEPTTVILADFDDVGFNNFTRRSEHVIYLSNPVLNQGRVSREQWLEHLLAHEYVHVLNGWALRRAGQAVGHWIEWSGMELQPQWFTEGICEYEAAGRTTGPLPYVLDAAREGELLAGAKLDIREARFDVIETAMVYQQGHAMVREMVRRHGPDIIRRLLDQYAHTPQFDIAFLTETGETVESFTRRFLAEAARQAGPAPPQPGEPLGLRLEAALAARLSPDGARLAAYGVADWEDPVPALYLSRPDGSGQKKIATNLDLYDSWKFTWSPDSRYLIYVGRIKDRHGSVRNALYAYDAARGKGWKLDTGDTRVLEPEFSPDGRRLAFVTYRDERAILALLDLDTMAVREVTGGIAASCFAPTWSPDGDSLAFSLAAPESVDIAVIGADGTGFRRLTDDPEPDQYPAWSPDGRQIAFCSSRGARRGGRSAAVSAEGEGLAGSGTGLYAVPAGGGTVAKLGAGDGDALYYPTWTADGDLLACALGVRRAKVVRLPGPSAPASAVGPQPAGGSPAPAERQVLTIGGPAREYAGSRRIRPFILRPLNGEDGLGDTWGVRARWSDPLARQTAVAEAQVGVESDEVSYELQYLDDQTPVRLGAGIFRRVPPPRGERGALVAEVSQGFELLAEWPVALTSNPYAKDSLIFGFEVAEHTPFGTAGGALRPPPLGAWLCVPSLGWRRVQFIPGSGDQEVRIKISRADNAWGSDLDFARADALWARRFYAPDPRHTLTAGAALSIFDGQDFTRREVQQYLLAGEVRYDVRLAEELLSRQTWPYLHIGPVHLIGSYQLRELISGTAGGADLRDRMTIELTNEGYLSRHVVYLLRAGQRWHIGGDEASETYLGIEFDFRDMPF